MEKPASPAKVVALSTSVTLVVAGCFSSGSKEVAPTPRPPTHAEREAIVRPLATGIANTPAACLQLNIRVSRSGEYAFVGREVLNSLPGSRCLIYQSNGFQILRKTERWRIVYSGSDPPPCSLKIPPEVIPPAFGEAGDPKLRCLNL
jgi:hypothetical protein